MLTYIPLLMLSTAALHYYLPVLQGPQHSELLVQAVRAYLVLHVAVTVTNFVWRRKFVPKLRLKPANHAVLITGCDTGFGNLLARKLDKAGFKVFACCLLPDQPDSQKLKRECSARLQVIKMDVTSDADVEAAYETVEKALERDDQQLLAVVSNAGILATGEAEFGSMEPFERQVAINCLGTIRVTKAFSPLLRRCETSPRLVCVTSLAARIGLPGMVGYCVSKSGALAFANAIRVELMKWNVKVVSVEPHLFRTNLVASEMQHKALQRLWDTSRRVTRQDYGPDFFEGAKRLLERGIDDARSNIPDVVDALYDSVTLRHPETFNRIYSNELERLRGWFLMFQLAPCLQDLLLHWGASLVTGKPAGVKRRAGSKRAD